MHEPLLINPAEQADWNDLLISTPGYSFFHTANWAEVLNRSYDYQPLYIYVKDDKTLESIIPIMEVASPLTGKRGVCLPFTDYCDPLVAGSNQFQDLLNTAIDLGKKRKWEYLEIRGGRNYLAEKTPAQVFWGHLLDLTPGQQKLFSGLRDSTRRNIKKAQNEKVEVNISNTLSAVKEFCRLNALTRREHGLPPQPYRFFHNLFHRVIARNMGFVASAYVSDRVVAANIYLHFGSEVIYKYGASDRRYQHLRANNLVMWEAIRWSCDKGFKQMSFGRTEPEHEGLMQFKAGWGAKQYRICYFKYNMGENAFVSDSGSISPVMNKVFSKLPIPVLKTLGKVLYRHMG